MVKLSALCSIGLRLVLTICLLNDLACGHGRYPKKNKKSYNRPNKLKVRAKVKVKVTLFYESMCPYSKAFITTQLYTTYTRLQDYMEVDVVPFGNGHIGERTLRSNKTYYSITCQHGSKECKGNKIEACAVKYFKKTTEWLSVIACMSTFSDPYNRGKRCVEDRKLQWTRVSRCANGEEGERLLYEMGMRTNRQIPHVRHVPYIVVGSAYDKQAERQAVKNLFKLVCDRLGKDKPQVCKAE